MSVTSIVYKLMCISGINGAYQVAQPFSSEAAARAHATRMKDDVAQDYQILAVITTESVLDSFTVPAYVPTVEEIAADIIGGSNGSFYMEWGEQYAALSLEDQRKVEDIVNEEIGTCDCCGWHWATFDLEQSMSSGQLLCWKCAEDEENEDELEDEDED